MEGGRVLGWECAILRLAASRRAFNIFLETTTGRPLTWTIWPWPDGLVLLPSAVTTTRPLTIPFPVPGVVPASSGSTSLAVRKPLSPSTSLGKVGNVPMLVEGESPTVGYPVDVVTMVGQEDFGELGPAPGARLGVGLGLSPPDENASGGGGAGMTGSGS